LENPGGKVNKVILLGNLGADPVIKKLNSGETCCIFSLANSESFTDKDGKKQTKKVWTRIVCWKKTADLASKFLFKGRQVLVEGKLSHRTYERNGVKMNTSEVVASNLVFLGGKSSQHEESDNSQNQKQTSKPI